MDAAQQRIPEDCSKMDSSEYLYTVNCTISSKARRPFSAPLLPRTSATNVPIPVSHPLSPKFGHAIPASPSPMSSAEAWLSSISSASSREAAVAHKKRLAQRLRNRPPIFNSKPKDPPMVRGRHLTRYDVFADDAKRWLDVPGHVVFDRIASRDQRVRLWSHGMDFGASRPGALPNSEDVENMVSAEDLPSHLDVDSSQPAVRTTSPFRLSLRPRSARGNETGRGEVSAISAESHRSFSPAGLSETRRGTSFAAQSARDKANQAYFREKDVHDFSYDMPDPMSDVGIGYYPPMDKTCSREQRAKGMGYFSYHPPTHSLLFYDTQPVAKHMRSVQMDRTVGRDGVSPKKARASSARSARHADTSGASVCSSSVYGGARGVAANTTAGNSLDRFYDPNYSLVTNPLSKSILNFGDYTDRAKPSSSMRIKMKISAPDLDIGLFLNPKLPSRRRVGAAVDMAKQVPRDVASRLTRVNPAGAVDVSVVPLRPKYTAVDPSSDKTVAFGKQLARGNDSYSVNAFKARTVTSHLENYDVQKAFVATKAQPRGFNLEKQLSRDRTRLNNSPASSVAPVIMEPGGGGERSDAIGDDADDFEDAEGGS